MILVDAPSTVEGDRYVLSLNDAAAGRLAVPLHRTYTLDEIRSAHADMEANSATGKLVVVL